MADWGREPLPDGADVLSPGPGTAIVAPDDTADAVVLQLTLHRAEDVDGLFARVRSVLRPGGTLVVVTPSVAPRSMADLRWRGLLRPAHRGPWRHRAALDDAGWLLAAADFAVLGDDRAPYALPVPDADAAHRAVDLLPAAGLWPELDDATRTRLAEGIARRAGPRCRLPVPLRRLVGRR